MSQRDFRHQYLPLEMLWVNSENQVVSIKEAPKLSEEGVNTGAGSHFGAYLDTLKWMDYSRVCKEI